MQSVNLTHHFLIAMPNMADPHFSRTLTYICEHNEQGALGLVINRPLDMTLAKLLDQVSIPAASAQCNSIAVHYGGPVQTDRGFVLHGPVGNWQSTLSISPEIGLTTSKDILEAVARDHEAADMLRQVARKPEQLLRELEELREAAYGTGVAWLVRVARHASLA